METDRGEAVTSTEADPVHGAPRSPIERRRCRHQRLWLPSGVPVGIGENDRSCVGYRTYRWRSTDHRV